MGLDKCPGYGTSGLRDCTKIRVGMKGFSNRIEDLLNRPALLLDLTMLFERLLATYALTTPVFSSSAKSLMLKVLKCQIGRNLLLLTNET